MNIYEKLLEMQLELKAPKNQYNDFGKYKYRSLEDILEGLKPILKKHKATLILADEVENIGERNYIKATATLVDIVESKSQKVSVTAYAREAESQKGMNASQLTGSTSSYARKYALNGLFAIDDTKDSDANNTGNPESPKKETKPNKKPATKSNLATENELTILYGMVKEKDYSNSIVGYIKSMYGKNSSKELTSEEVSEIIEMLKGK